MVMPFPSVEVKAPRTDRSLGTLLGTFDPVPTDDEHWELGYHFPTWGACLTAFPWGPCLQDVTKQPGIGSTTVETVPIGIYAPFKCSTFGWSEDEYKAAALDALQWQGGMVMEAELWSGVMAIQNGWPNLYLTAPTSTIVGNGSLYPSQVALALLQKDLRACLGDSIGVIHASSALVSLWHSNFDIDVVDGRLLDMFGNVIVAAPGYPGGAPAVDAEYSLASTGDGGTLTITVTSPITGVSETTAPIAFDASAAVVLAALELLTIIEPGDVLVGGGALGTNPVTFTFSGRFVGQPITMTINSTLITGGAATLTELQIGGSILTAGEEWAYGTSMIDVRVGGVQLIDEDPRGSIDRATNTAEFIAETTMSATWDGCCHFAVKASLNPCACWPT